METGLSSGRSGHPTSLLRPSWQKLPLECDAASVTMGSDRSFAAS